MSHLPQAPAPGDCAGSRRPAAPVIPGTHAGSCPVCWTLQPLLPLSNDVADHRPNVPNA